MPALDAPTMPSTPTPHAPASPPTVVGWLGYGGLIPFAALAAASVVSPKHLAWWSPALLSYGAVILSFVGALHWGFAMGLRELPAAQRSALFAWSVVPSLLAWPALLVGGAVGSALLIAGFAAHFVQDLRLAGKAALPAWYLPLRLRLTVTACACLAVGAVSRVMAHG